MTSEGRPTSPLVEFHHYRRSRLHRLGVGRWFCSDRDNGPALRDAPHRVNGLWLNTPRGLFGVTWRRSDV